MEITKYGWIKGDRTEQVVGNQTEFWGACSFRLCRLRTDHCSPLLLCWTHASHLASRIKYLSTAKLVALFRPGSIRVRGLVLKGVWRGCEEWVQGRVSWLLAVGRSLGRAVLVCPTVFTGIMPLVIYSSFDRWVSFVWGINHQLVRNQFESPSLLNSEHLTRAMTS
jgi:hypothetical protein